MVEKFKQKLHKRYINGQLAQEVFFTSSVIKEMQMKTQWAYLPWSFQLAGDLCLPLHVLLLTWPWLGWWESRVLGVRQMDGGHWGRDRLGRVFSLRQKRRAIGPALLLGWQHIMSARSSTHTVKLALLRHKVNAQELFAIIIFCMSSETKGQVAVWFLLLTLGLTNRL